MSITKDYSQYDLNDMSEISNQAKDIFVSNMLEENIITESQYKQMQNYSIIAVQEKTLGSFCKKLWSQDKTSSHLIVVKVSNHTKPEEE